MKINWKVRFKSKAFWLTFVPTVLGFVYAILGALGVVPKISKDSIEALIIAVIGILASLGIVVDPTTEGVEDSERAMSYDEPYKREERPGLLKRLFSGFLKGEFGVNEVGDDDDGRNN